MFKAQIWYELQAEGSQYMAWSPQAYSKQQIFLTDNTFLARRSFIFLDLL